MFSSHYRDDPLRYYLLTPTCKIDTSRNLVWIVKRGVKPRWQDVFQRSPALLRWWIARSLFHQGTQEDTIEAMYLRDTRSCGNGNSCSSVCTCLKNENVNKCKLKKYRIISTNTVRLKKIYDKKSNRPVLSQAVTPTSLQVLVIFRSSTYTSPHI